MRTTLNLDDDVLEALRLLARQRGTSLGAEVSRLVRKALAGTREPDAGEGIGGFKPFAAGGRVVTDELVDGLRDREGV